MSADLFAEFGFGPTSQNTSSSQQQQVTPQTNSLVSGLGPSEDNVSTGSWESLSQLQSQTADQSVYANKNNTTTTKSNAMALSSIHDDSVLFDAALESSAVEGDDVWGEFASAETPVEHNLSTRTDAQLGNNTNSKLGSSHQPKGSGTLLDTDDLMSSLSIEDRMLPTKSQQTSTGAKTSPRPSNKKSLASAAPSVRSNEEFFDEWGDFVAGKSTEPGTGGARKEDPGIPNADNRRKSNQNENPTVQAKTNNNQPHNRSDNRASSTQVRPTNIPPPSVLLQLFPQLFEQLQREASRLRRDPNEKAALGELASTICCTLKVAARVIAGRTLRWKRDSILSQSMRIGPARAGKPGGMKLNTINKSESIKEKQETLDVLEMWRDCAGVFNSAILSSGKRPIQVISESARVITAGPETGALKAPHACALCGLKRDERLQGQIDEKVEDSFVEWWTEHWGHTDCRIFWTRNVHLLSQR